jgi:hypothetical protein
MIVTKGATDVTDYVMMVDSSTGQPETGLTITNFDLQYTRNQSTPAAKVDAVALAATNTAHTDNRAIEVDATSSPGLYRIDWPDAAFASGADKVILVVTCAGCAPAVRHVSLVNYNTQDGVRMGLTALPNAAADAAGGLIISDAGGLDADAQRADVAAILVDTGTTLDGRIPAALVSGRMDCSVGAMAANVLTASAIASDAITAAKIADGAIDAATFAAGAITATVIADGAIDAATFAAGAIDASAIAANAIGASELATDAVTEIVDAVWAAAARTLTAIDEDSTTLDLDATIRGALGMSSANLDTQLAALAAYVDTEIGTIITNLGTIAGYIDTEVASIKAVTDKLDNTLTSTSDGYVFSGVALQAVWDEPLAGHLVSGTTGAALNTASATAEKLDNTLTSTSDGYVFNSIALQQVWDEPIAGHLTAGSTGAALNAAGGAGDPWSTALPGAYGAGTAGYILDAVNDVTVALATMLMATSDGYAFTANALEFAPSGGLDAAGVRAALGMSSANLDTQLAAIDSKTTNLPSDPADQSLIIAATNALSSLIGSPAGASVSADIAAVKGDTVDIEADTQDIQSRLPAALISGRLDVTVGAMQNDVVTAAAVAANAIDASALAADAAAEIADAVWDEAVSGHTSGGTFGKALDDTDDRGSRTVVRGTVGGGSTTTSIVTSAFTPAGAVADQFKGRIVIFDNDTATAELRGQGTDITASSNSATPTLTVTLLTTAPASGDTFSIV